MKKYNRSILAKIISWKIIAVILCIFILGLLPVNLLPDIFKLGVYQDKKDLVFRLLSTLIGFSGLILTVLLVIFNFHIKSVRRNILDFIFENKWLRIIFSLFFGVLLFLCFSFFIVNSQHGFNDLTILYLCLILAFGFIISLIPLAICSLNDSASLNKVYRLLNKVNASTLSDISHNFYKDETDIENPIDENPILILKDLSINAIADKDWLLPQTVLKSLYDKLIISLSNTPNKVAIIQTNLDVWALFCNHLKREVIKNNDFVTGGVLLSKNFAAHEYFADKKIIFLRNNPVDSFIIEYLRCIAEDNAFFEVQSYFLRYTTDIIKKHFKNVNYSDEQVPTLNYRLSSKSIAPEDYIMTPERNYWFYLTHELPDVVFLTLRNAIDLKRKNIYDHFSWSINILLDSIFKMKNLTVHQKRDALQEYMHKAENVSKYAIDNGIYEGVDVVSHIQMQVWIKEDEQLGLRAFYSFIRMIKLLHSKNALSSIYIDDLFMIGREISGHEAKVATIVIDSILETTFGILKNEEIQEQIKNDFQYQLKWFKDAYLNELDNLTEVNNKYKKQVAKFLASK